MFDGFHKKHWVTAKSLNSDQACVTTALVKEHDVGGNAYRLQRRTARKANEGNLAPQNQKSEITSL